MNEFPEKASRLIDQGLFDLSGRVAIVTGGSRGLGRSIVSGLAGAGADVVIASRKLENCERVAGEVSRETGRRTLAVRYHAGHWDDSERLLDRVIEEFGVVDVLVNNAGMSPTYQSLPAITEELYDKTLGVNLKGPFRLGVLSAERMAAARGGSIVNISSIGSMGGGGGGARRDPTEPVRSGGGALPYACAKAGLNVLTVGLAQTYAPAVRVNAVLAGSFWTDASKHWADGLVDPHAIPLGRIADPREMVGTVLYLASDASSFTTGAMLRVDGGVAARV
jgi:NAD(P)-dependent dehydrogenase (short-subunit alcohol dehydrogenase family)